MSYAWRAVTLWAKALLLIPILSDRNVIPDGVPSGAASDLRRDLDGLALLRTDSN